MKTFVVKIYNDVIDIITAKGLEKHFRDKLNLMTEVTEEGADALRVCRMLIEAYDKEGGSVDLDEAYILAKEVVKK